MNAGQNISQDATKRKINKAGNFIPVQEHGKLPPQAVDLEEAVLGAMMLEKKPLNEVIDILSIESFYKESHQKIYAAICILFQNNEPIDILTVTSQLKKSGELEIVGGAYYITQLTNRIASAANIVFHARIILQKFIQRELIRISSETIRDAYEDSSDVFDLLDKAESNLFSIAEKNISKNYEGMNSLLKQAVEQIEKARHTEGVSGVPSGFTALDRITSGWQPSDLVIMAARPGMGKTAFVLSLARNTAVQYKKGVAIFSLEMSSVQLVNRLIAGETELSAEKLKKGKLENYEWQQLLTKIKTLETAPIYIDDTPALSVFELRAKCRRLKAQHDIDLVVIDYLQLMTAGGDNKGGNREQEISTISRSLKSIAKELNIPIIALSQLSRAVETRGGLKKPQLSDLRESGAIEQDADMVMFIYRPEYYQITQDEDGNAFPENLGQIIIAKHRNGSLEDVNLRFIPHLAKFVDYETMSLEAISSAGSVDNDFDNASSPSITFSSKMNKDFDNEAPF
ncbi:MAG: replicative DNA helicase [Bacteroidota bacterium]